MWAWIVVALLVVAAAVVAMLVSREWSAPVPLGAESPRYDGALAVTTLAQEDGFAVEEADDLAGARDAVGSGSTLVVTDATLLDPEVLADLAADAAHTIVLDADAVAASAVVPGATTGWSGDEALRPACDLPVARNAGPITAGRTLVPLSLDGITACYPSGDGYGLVRARVDADSIVTFVDGSAVFANGRLDERGDAALALGLLEGAGDIVWYTPSPADAGATGAPPTLGDLTPRWVSPAIVLAAVVALACAIWRGRRFGPLVAETLPVTVRAGETLEGRARLYRDARDPDHAWQAIRDGAMSRIARRLALAPGADVEQVAHAAAGATGRDPREVAALLADHPADDARLAELGSRLRALEHDVTESGEGHPR